MYMDIREIISETLANGGGTFPPVADGYMVGGVASGVIADMPKFEMMLGEFVQDNEAVLVTAHLGTWIHEGKVYIDVSERIGNREDAMRLARERGELAVYDIGTGTTIPVQ